MSLQKQKNLIFLGIINTGNKTMETEQIKNKLLTPGQILPSCSKRESLPGEICQYQLKTPGEAQNDSGITLHITEENNGYAMLYCDDDQTSLIRWMPKCPGSRRLFMSHVVGIIQDIKSNYLATGFKSWDFEDGEFTE